MLEDVKSVALLFTLHKQTRLNRFHVLGAFYTCKGFLFQYLIQLTTAVFKCSVATVKRLTVLQLSDVIFTDLLGYTVHSFL